MMKIPFIALFAVACTAHVVTFEGHKLVNVFLKDQRDIQMMANLPEVTDGVTGVDVWSNDGILVVGPNTVRLTPHGFESIRNSTLSYTVVHEDLQSQMDFVNSLPNEIVRNIAPNGPYDPVDQWFYKWHSYDEIQNKLFELVQKYPTIVKHVPKIGTSYEGRAIDGVKISGANPQRRVAIVSGTHAREWIAEGVAMWAIASLVEQYETNPEIKKIVDSLEIYIVPCYNPDGYEYSRNHNRYWRKNRSKQGSAWGVDQNRNWNANWGGAGASHSPSSDTYCGPSEMSEVEVRSIHDWLKSFGTQGAFAGALDLHSYSKLLLRPWAYQNPTCPDEAKLALIGKEFVRLISTIRKTKYDNIRASQLYVASGTAGDGLYILGIPSYVIELAGNDFVVPESEIKAQGEEIFEALKYWFTQASQ